MILDDLRGKKREIIFITLPTNTDEARESVAKLFARGIAQYNYTFENKEAFNLSALTSLLK